MSGTPSQAPIWGEFDVYVSTDLSVALPASAAASMPVGWGTPVGLMEGDTAIAFAQEEDVTPIFDFNGNFIGESHKNFMETVKFTILEDNAKTRALVHPGSPAGSIITPTIVPVKMALQASAGTRIHRLITDNCAYVRVDGGWDWKTAGIVNTPLIASIVPTLSTKARWLEQKTPTLVSIALTPLTLALSATTPLGAVVATGTYDDASTQVLTDIVTWSSSAPSKATVRFGDVTRVAAGTANITCSYLGITSAAPCVVTVT